MAQAFYGPDILLLPKGKHKKEFKEQQKSLTDHAFIHYQTTEGRGCRYAIQKNSWCAIL